MITIKHLTKTYRSTVKTGSIFNDFFHRQYQSHTAVDNISFTINSGELVGFIGPNGAGKTTTLKMLAGILYPTSGSINILGYTPFEKKHAYLRQIAFVMGQKNQLLWELPAGDAFRLNQAIYEISDDDFKVTLDELASLLGVSHLLSRQVKTLSLGERMKMELIGALIHRPKILFLDEPTIGLDIFAQSAIRTFIKTYQQEYKPTIILTSHYMQDVERLAGRVIMINKGKIVFDDTLAKLRSTDAGMKTVTIDLISPPGQDVHEYLKTIQHTLVYPQLKIRIEKKDLGSCLQYLLSHIEFVDVSIADDPLEEIVKHTLDQTQ